MLKKIKTKQESGRNATLLYFFVKYFLLFSREQNILNIRR